MRDSAATQHWQRVSAQNLFDFRDKIRYDFNRSTYGMAISVTRKQSLTLTGKALKGKKFSVPQKSDGPAAERILKILLADSDWVFI